MWSRRRSRGCHAQQEGISAKLQFASIRMESTMRFVLRHHVQRACLPRYSRRGLRASPTCSAASSAPKAVVFDLGKVLLDFDFSRSAQGLSAACQAVTPTRQEVLLELFGHAKQPTGLLEKWDGRSLVEQLERGQLDDRAFFEAVVSASGLQVDFSTFSAIYGHILTPLEEMIAQQQLLRSRGVPTFVLSNCSGLHIQDVRQRYPWFNSFDGYILSYEVHSFKPEPEIYAAAEDITQLAGSDLVFIDDREENAAAAAQRGWHAIHHTSPQQTLQQLRGLGLPVVDA